MSVHPLLLIVPTLCVGTIIVGPALAGKASCVTPPIVILHTLLLTVPTLCVGMQPPTLCVVCCQR